MSSGMNDTHLEQDSSSFHALLEEGKISLLGSMAQRSQSATAPSAKRAREFSQMATCKPH
jgi:hypothetical protein